MLPGGPLGHQVGIGQQHARRIDVGAEHADRLAGLDQQRLVCLQGAQALQDGLEAFPVARGLADAAVDDQRVGVLGDLGVEVVLQHAVGRLDQPVGAGDVGAARGAHGTGLGEATGDREVGHGGLRTGRAEGQRAGANSTCLDKHSQVSCLMVSPDRLALTDRPAFPDRPGFSDRAAANSARPPGAADAPSAPYAKVKRFLKDELSRGRWAPGALMPSEAELVGQFGVSRMTANRALRELQQEGLVERVQGVGTFAAQLHRVSSTLTIRDLHDEIAERGHRHHAEVHIVRAERAAGRAGAAPGPRRGRHGLPHADRPPRERHRAAMRRSLRESRLRPRLPERRFHPHHADALPARGRAALGGAVLDRGQPADPARRRACCRSRATEPCLVVVRRTVSRDVPITLARLVHPGSRYQIDGRFKP